MAFPPFQQFKRQGSLIGSMLTVYGELELSLCWCVNAAVDDFDWVFKSMFGTRGERQRVDIADAMARKAYAKLRLARQFDAAMAAMRHCLKIRNQWAHCHWHNDYSGQLAFVQLETAANTQLPVPNLDNVKIRHVTLAILREQETFFRVLLNEAIPFLVHQARIRRKVLRPNQNPFAMPSLLPQPPLCSPEPEPKNRGQGKEGKGRSGQRTRGSKKPGSARRSQRG